MESVSLVLPMYNEKEYLSRTVAAATAVMERGAIDYEIVIVDDASTDGSGMLADQAAQVDPRIKVVHHARNRKLGGALKSAFQAASKETVVYTDMDMPFDLDRLGDLLVLSGSFDIVKGVRANSRESWLRTLYSRLYNWLIRIVFRADFQDINFSLKIIRKKLLADLDLKSEGSFIDAEFMLKAKKLGYSVKEAALEYTPRSYGVSRLSSPAVILKILYEMAKFFPEISTYSPKKLLYKKIKACYQAAPLSVKAYNFFRFKTAPFDRMLEAFPAGSSVMDLGCGTGIFLNLIRNARGDGICRLTGMDNQPWKIEAAQKSRAGKDGALFRSCDIADEAFVPGANDCITLIDVLYYFKQDVKERIIRKCFDALPRGGVLLVKDIEKNLKIEYLWTMIQETIAIRLLRLSRSDGLFCVSRQEYSRMFEQAGFSVDCLDLSKGYLYPHILYVATKK